MPFIVSNQQIDNSLHYDIAAISAVSAMAFRLFGFNPAGRVQQVSNGSRCHFKNSKNVRGTRKKPRGKIHFAMIELMFRQNGWMCTTNRTANGHESHSTINDALCALIFRHKQKSENSSTEKKNDLSTGLCLKPLLELLCHTDAIILLIGVLAIPQMPLQLEMKASSTFFFSQNHQQHKLDMFRRWLCVGRFFPNACTRTNARGQRLIIDAEKKREKRKTSISDRHTIDAIHFDCISALLLVQLPMWMSWNWLCRNQIDARVSMRPL